MCRYIGLPGKSLFLAYGVLSGTGCFLTTARHQCGLYYIECVQHIKSSSLLVVTKGRGLIFIQHKSSDTQPTFQVGHLHYVDTVLPMCFLQANTPCKYRLHGAM